MIYVTNPSTQELTETGGSEVGGHPGLHSEFEAKLSYILRCCLINK